MSKLGYIDRRQFIAVATAATTAAAIPSFVAAQGPRTVSGRTRLFDDDWRFFKGTGDGFESPNLDDSTWRRVDLPHDWSIEDLPVVGEASGTIGPFDRKAIGGTATGFSVGGEGWYRKAFTMPANIHQSVEILFDGAYANSDVWLNGHHLGGHVNGYTPFSFDLTPFLVAGGINILAVRVRNLGRNSRWYSGSGLYRHVWLDLLPRQSRIARWGAGVTTRRVVGLSAELEVETNLEHSTGTTSVLSKIKDPQGRTVWEGTTSGGSTRQAAKIKNAMLWSPESPSLYTLETRTVEQGQVIDSTTTRFGIRVISFDASMGMVLNGKPTKLRGGCVHHDHGLLGAASFDAAEERKVRLLKERGFNAVRATHNPFSPAFLDACDRLGMMVIAEAFDMWRWPKTPDDYSGSFDADWRQALTAMILQMRHHPSIVMWSIGNEIPNRNSSEGVKLQWELGNHVHHLDPTRPVTAAINDFQGRELIPSAETARPGRGGRPDQASMVFLDVAGYNYKVTKYESDHNSYPERIIYGSESFSKDMAGTWDLAGRSPWLVGDFVWTAIDYLGEAALGGSSYVSAKYASGPAALGSWPYVVSACGEIDLIGQRKGPALARDVLWGLSQVEIAVQKAVPEGRVEVPRLWGWRDERPSWTWPGAENKSLSVSVYSCGDRVELWLNGARIAGKSLATTDGRRAEFSVPYQQGTLEAVAFTGEREIGRTKLQTAGAPAAIRMVPEVTSIKRGRGEIAYVLLEIVDSTGRHVGDVETDITIEVEGSAELIGFGSGNLKAVGSFQQKVSKTWDGRALAVVRSTGRAGLVRIKANAGTLRGSTIVLHPA